jgi:hypothetical protein
MRRAGVQAMHRQEGGKQVGVRRSRPSPPFRSTDLAVEEQSESSMCCAGVAARPGSSHTETELDVLERWSC